MINEPAPAGNPVLTVESLPSIIYHGHPVISTECLAKAYGVKPKQIRDNFTQNQGRFAEGKHFFKLEGNDLRDFRDCTVLNGSVVPARTRNFLLWTAKGSARHAKMLNTDSAWDVYERMEDGYFSAMEADLARQQPYPIPTTITPSQQQELQNIVAAKASAFPKETLGRIRAQLWSRLHNKFKVAKYDQLPAGSFPEAVEYLVGLAVRGAFPMALPDAEPPKSTPTVKALPGRRRIAELDQADIARRLGLLKQRTNSLILEYFEFTRELHQPFNDVACDKENYDPDAAGMMTAVNYGLQYFNRVACGNLETMQSLAEFATHAASAFRKVEHLPASGTGR
jgi:hypothetical protein